MSIVEMSLRRTHYHNLKVSQDATAEQIRTAYKKLCQKFHPDKNTQDSDAVRKFQLITQAYQILSDKEARHRHDQWISTTKKEAISASIDSIPRNALITGYQSVKARDSIPYLIPAPSNEPKCYRVNNKKNKAVKRARGVAQRTRTTKRAQSRALKPSFAYLIRLLCLSVHFAVICITPANTFLDGSADVQEKSALEQNNNIPLENHHIKTIPPISIENKSVLIPEDYYSHNEKTLNSETWIRENIF